LSIGLRCQILKIVLVLELPMNTRSKLLTVRVL
jgi:hypothetical protein